MSAPALDQAGVILNRQDAEGQRLLRERIVETRMGGADPQPVIPDFRGFASSVLGWRFAPAGYAGTEECPIPPELEAAMPESGLVLRPDFAVRTDPLRNSPTPATPASDNSTDSATETPPWQLLVSVNEIGEDLDSATSGNRNVESSPHTRMERMLRQTGVPAGLLFNGTTIRLVSAPRGESSGWLDFRVADMRETAGRPICSAMRELLGETRLLALPKQQRLPALLESSRKYQNEVSERLAEQVLHSLYELLRGFQAAHDATRGALLEQLLRDNPDEVYRGLLTVVLRLVFLLYSEERDMLPQDQVFLGAYSLSGLYDRLREDAALHPDTMDERYGAYAQLLALFRMVYDGATTGDGSLPRRQGDLFDPERYKFLEGRSEADGARQVGQRIEAPLVPDGTIYRVLEKLVLLDGERISYRALDVEHVGSVYETMMGFRLETATGLSTAIRSNKKQGAPSTVNIEGLLAEPRAGRAKWLQVHAGRNIPPGVSAGIRDADSVEALVAALSNVIDKDATPDLVSTGAMVLQPSHERRASGSHYTPRELTGPIVRTTLEPVLQQLRDENGVPPTPEQILDLKVCDPAMGSGAFLVEACRQLGDALVQAWRAHDAMPDIPSDEDELLVARRMVAQRCIYGVDRNPKAVDLAKLSLWLVTLAKEHPLTFLDHSLRHGDSLVGLSRKQIEAFHWKANAPAFQAGFEAIEGQQKMQRVSELRQQIRQADDSVPDWELRRIWDEASEEMESVRLLGDLAVAAYFEGANANSRKQKRNEFAAEVNEGKQAERRDWLADKRDAEPPLAPFHWDLEFPEVFERDNPGFDAFVGNPPFQGGRGVSKAQGDSYSSWLRTTHVESSGGSDLVAHFFRRAFDLLRDRGTFGLIATNTIAQGDTRSSGLRWICEHGGEIYNARTRYSWPGQAAVVVSVVHVCRGVMDGPKFLDGSITDKITAFLFHAGTNNDPARLSSNSKKSFIGSAVLGMGFTFDDTDTQGIASPLPVMKRVIEENPNSSSVIYPYIGGEEVNLSPFQAYHRYAINFGERSEADCRKDWPELMSILESRVKPERVNKDARKYPRMVNEWWKYWNPRPELHSTIAGLHYVLAVSRVGQQLAIALLPTGMVYADSLVVFPFDNYAAFCALQARPHEIWARFFASSMKDDLRYTPSDCFETFPFPMGWESHEGLEAVGREYYEHRAALMVKNDEGLTKTYNRFHDPYEDSPEIGKLRELHTNMDRAVLDAYGWSDIATDCEFLLDYPIDDAEWGKKKKPYRYRWPDEVRDTVLARLLELNGQRAAEEARAGKGRNSGKRRSKAKPTDSSALAGSTLL